MTAAERLLRQIEELKESIEIDWEDLHSNPLREVERKNVRAHLEACESELKKLISRFSAMKDNNSE